MKKILVFLAAISLSIAVQAQVNLHFTPVTFTTEGIDASQRVWADMSLCRDNFNSYAEVQKSLNDAGDFYVQLFHEQKFWETPLYLHLEYRGQGGEMVEHMAMAGLTYSLNTKSGFIALTPLCRIDGEAGNWGKVQPMFSVVTGHDWGKFNLNSFTDFWYDGNYFNNGFNWYTEYWAYVNVTEHLELGAVGTFLYGGKFIASIAPAIKVKF